MMKTILVLLLPVVCMLSFSVSSFALTQQIVLEDSQGEYVTKMVRAKNVRGVEVRLSKVIIRDDCNTRTISLANVLVSGSGDGWYDKYFLDTQITQTKMYCPLDTPIKETIYSGPMVIKSFTNENVKGEVRVSIVIPKGFKLEAVEVK
jgi:hypothetical protein